MLIIGAIARIGNGEANSRRDQRERFIIAVAEH